MNTKNILFDEPDVWRGKLIDAFVKKYGFNSYLEIGFLEGLTFNLVNCANKTAVDPSPRRNDSRVVSETSNNFFKNNNKKFDIIFIDGDHEKSQVYLDFKNSYNCLNDNGIIIFHDVNPPSEKGTVLTAHGDCFQTWINMFNVYKLKTYVNSFDAVGIFFKTLNPKWIDIDLKPYSYQYFAENRNKYIHNIRITEDLNF